MLMQAHAVFFSDPKKPKLGPSNDQQLVTTKCEGRTSENHD
jgi:hypothetical protein